MSFHNLFNKMAFSSISRRLTGTYKVIKRPDPNNFKIPSSANTLSLMDIIAQKIKLSGPITVADYMNLVLTNPVEGYYMNKEMIGEGGDFITSPEITQLFGEIIGLWFFSESNKLCSGVPLNIVELGPGRGTLLVDILRVISRIGVKSSDVSLHLVEISPVMRNIQAHHLCFSHRSSDDGQPHYYEGETTSGCKVFWYDDLKKVPHGYSWFVAHEFFDVLPIHKFQKTKSGWREVLIDIDEAGKLQYRIAGNENRNVQILLRPPLCEDDRTEIEVSAKGLGIARQLAERVDQFGGITLIADYGHEGEKSDTFRAFYKHKLVNPLENPGLHDLTADVDFRLLRLAASKTPGDENHALVLGPVTQMDFLKRSQADIRLEMLIQNAKEEDKDNLKLAYELLTDPSKMGERFKFMAFYPSAMADIINKYPPLGFSS